MDNHSMDALSMRGHPQERNKLKIKDLGGDINLRVDLNPQEKE